MFCKLEVDCLKKTLFDHRTLEASKTSLPHPLKISNNKREHKLLLLLEDSINKTNQPTSGST